jgi:hypothetical protein
MPVTATEGEKSMSCRSLVWSVIGLSAALAVGSSPADAQPPGVQLLRAEGAVTLNEQPVAPSSAPVALGDSTVIQTADGQAVVALKHGGNLALAARSRVRILGNGTYNFNRIEMLGGTAIILSDTSAPLVTCRSIVRLSSGGIFRFDVQPERAGVGPTCRFRVYDGGAAVTLVTVISVLRSGQTMTLDPTCGDMVPSNAFAVDQLDDFDRWSRLQRAAVH